MKLPSFRRLFSSDYRAEMKQFVDQFGVIYNANTESVYDALNNKLTFQDNFAATIADFTVNVNERGVPNQKTQLKMSNNQTTVSGIMVISALGGNNGTILPLAGVYVNATKDGDFLTIQHVKGIPVGVNFRIKAVVLA